MSRKTAAKRPFTIPSADGKPSADTAVRRWRRLYAQSERVHLPPSAAGECRAHGRGKRGQGHRMVPLPPLDSPKPSFAPRLPAVARRNAGAHRDVWCTKSTPLIEAELFAAQDKRPALSGRALLCAASYARKIQGNKASKNLPDARNRAPVTPVSLHISDVSAQRKVRGVKRGQETMFGVLSPFAPVGGHRPSAAEGGNAQPAHRQLFSPPPASPLYRRNRVPSAEGEKFLSSA